MLSVTFQTSPIFTVLPTKRITFLAHSFFFHRYSSARASSNPRYCGILAIRFFVSSLRIPSKPFTVSRLPFLSSTQVIGVFGYGPVVRLPTRAGLADLAVSVRVKPLACCT